jgi:hypothetical protein
MCARQITELQCPIPYRRSGLLALSQFRATVESNSAWERHSLTADSGYEIACVFGQIPLLSQSIEADDGLRVDSQRCRQCLNCRLMMSRLAGQCPVAVSM